MNLFDFFRKKAKPKAKTDLLLESPFLTKEQAAKYLRYSCSQLDRYRKEGLISPPVHPNIRKKVLFSIQEVMSLERKLRRYREEAVEGCPKKTKGADS